MKKWGILLLAGLVGAFVLTGCQPAVDLSGYAKLSDLSSSKAECQACHSSAYNDYSLVNTDKYPSATNETAYTFSGHNLGLREDFYSAAAITAGQPNTTTAAWASGYFNQAGQNHGITAPATSGTWSASCVKCHTGTGFAYYISNGTALTSGITVPAGKGGMIGCTACHDPMTNGDYALRTEKAVSLVTGGSYNAGAGNLCANCHQSQSGSTSSLATDIKLDSATGAVNYDPPGSHGPVHHGPQADFLLGTINAGSVATTNGYTASGTFAQSPHYMGDSCVTCHVTDNVGTGQQSSHGMYLTTAATADTPTDYTAVCVTCHTSADNTQTTWIAAFGATSSKGTMLSNIYSDYATLLVYFNDATHFYSSATSTTAMLATGAKGPVVSPTATATPYSATIATTSLSDLSNRYNVDWTYNGAGYYLSKSQAQALMNLVIFAEDKSVGVHNPQFAAQLLFDSITVLNAGDSASLASAWSTTRP